MTQPKLNMNQNMSESSAKDMPIKLKSLNSSGDLDGFSFAYSIMGATILFEDKPTLNQMQAIRIFFDELTDEIIEEKVNGLLSTK